MTPSTAQPTLALTMCRSSTWKSEKRTGTTTRGEMDGPLTWATDTTMARITTTLMRPALSRSMPSLKRDMRAKAGFRCNSCPVVAASSKQAGAR